MLRELWRVVHRTDPHGTGWWQLGRLIGREDGTLQLELENRSSVVSVQLDLTPEQGRELRDALDRWLS